MKFINKILAKRSARIKECGDMRVTSISNEVRTPTSVLLYVRSIPKRVKNRVFCFLLLIIMLPYLIENC